MASRLSLLSFLSFSSPERSPDRFSLPVLERFSSLSDFVNGFLNSENAQNSPHPSEPSPAMSSRSIEQNPTPISHKPSPLIDEMEDLEEETLPKAMTAESRQILKEKGLMEDAIYIETRKDPYFVRGQRNFTQRMEIDSAPLKRPLTVTEDGKFFLIFNDKGSDKVIEGGSKVFSHAMDLDSGMICACLDAPCGEDDPVNVELYIYDQLKSCNFWDCPELLHVVKYKDENGFPRIRMFVSLCPRSLQEAIASGLNEPEKDRIFSQAGLVICSFHEMGLIHRDVKIGNFLISDQGKILLTDFDTAGKQGMVGKETRKRVHGTIAYAAPETIKLLQ